MTRGMESMLCTYEACFLFQSRVRTTTHAVAAELCRPAWIRSKLSRNEKTLKRFPRILLLQCYSTYSTLLKLDTPSSFPPKSATKKTLIWKINTKSPVLRACFSKPLLHGTKREVFISAICWWFFLGGLLGLFWMGVKADWRYAGLNRDTHSRERDIWAVGISRGCCVRKIGLSSLLDGREGAWWFFYSSRRIKVMFPRGKSDRVPQDWEMWDGGYSISCVCVWETVLNRLAVLYPDIQTYPLVLMESITIMNSRHHFERYLDSWS